jgi:hypothetical protein
VNPLRFPLLADENIGPEVVAGLRTRGCDIRTAAEEALLGQPDASVLARAQLQARVVVTHDRGFGRSAIATVRRLSALSIFGPDTSLRRSFWTSPTRCWRRLSMSSPRFSQLQSGKARMCGSASESHHRGDDQLIL